MKNDSTLDEIKKKFPEFIEYIDKNYKKKCKIYVIGVVACLLLLFSVAYFFPSEEDKLFIFYEILGAFLVSFGAIKTPKELALLNVQRWGYSKELAHDMMKNSFLVGFGLILILLSFLLDVLPHIVQK